jgi:hypothetical protein
MLRRAAVCYIGRSTREGRGGKGTLWFGFFPKISTTVENIVEKPFPQLNHDRFAPIFSDFRLRTPVLWAPEGGAPIVTLAQSGRGSLGGERSRFLEHSGVSR